MTGRNDSLREDRDFAGGGRAGCVQITLRASHRLPIGGVAQDRVQRPIKNSCIC